jgi:hypothetical protein
MVLGTEAALYPRLIQNFNDRTVNDRAMRRAVNRGICP